MNGFALRMRGGLIAATLLAFVLAVPARADGPVPAPPKEPPPKIPVSGFPAEGVVSQANGTQVYFYRTNFVKPDVLILSLTNLIKLPGVTLRDFPRQNQVLIEGTQEEIETALDAIAYFDIPDPQVFVEAKIIEVTYESNFEFGLSGLWDRDVAGPNTFFRGGTMTLNPPSFFQSQLPGNLPFQGVGISFGWVGKAAEEFGFSDLTLQALERDGTAEILSRPSIIATEKVRAEVKTGQRTPILQIANAVGVSNVDTLNLTTSYVDTKIGLAVTPNHIGDAFVTMLVEPTVSTVTGFSYGQGGTSAPIISDRNANTVVTMADGDTLIIGGLYTNATLKDTAKFPFLGDIPCLGKLFTRVRDQKVKTELVFFITPHILRKKSDYKIITPPSEKERLDQGGATCPGPTPAGVGRPAR